LNRSARLSIALCILVLSALSVVEAFADAPPAVAKFVAKGFPDNVDLRGRLFAYVIGASRDVAVNYGEKRLQSAAGQVTVRVEKRTNDFIVEFINPSASDASVAGRGSCYIQRSNAKGNYIQQARILLEDDPSCFLTLYPSGSGTRGDVVMYGAVVKKGLYFSDMIYRILLLSFADIVDATSRSFDWATVFKFGGSGPSVDYLAELRSSMSDQAVAEQPSAAPAAAPIALGGILAAKIALAAAPSIQTTATEATPKGPRSARLAAVVDRASSIDALLLDLAASGESVAREISPAQDSAAAFVDDRGDIAKIVYGEYPRYDSRGIALSVLRSALYFDSLSNPDSAYALVGEGLRAVVVPSFDEAGRFGFAVFSGGKETAWTELSSGKRDLKVRVVRLPLAM